MGIGIRWAFFGLLLWALPISSEATTFHVVDAESPIPLSSSLVKADTLCALEIWGENKNARRFQARVIRCFSGSLSPNSQIWISDPQPQAESQTTVRRIVGQARLYIGLQAIFGLESVDDPTNEAPANLYRLSSWQNIPLEMKNGELLVPVPRHSHSPERSPSARPQLDFSSRSMNLGDFEAELFRQKQKLSDQEWDQEVERP